MKLALIKKKDSSFWRSCQSITSNLEESYLKLCQNSGHTCEVLTYETHANSLESHDLATLVLEKGFDQVIWLDHYPHPQNLIKVLLKHEGKLPKFIIHLFGDFILQAPLWNNVQDEIEKSNHDFEMHFVCASQKQKELVHSLLNSSNSEDVSVIPFPVDELTFFYNEEDRQKRRIELDIKEDETLFFYSGRLSYQKNIIDAIYTFATYSKTFDPKAKLILSGPMDDLGVPYLGKEALDGTFFFHWEECLREHTDLVDSNRIIYLGNLTHRDLAATYCAADVFLSLSCHNDEDYGMSPAEALCSGLPCLLTDWGGYGSFKAYAPDSVCLVPVLPGEQRHGPHRSLAVKGLASLGTPQDRGALTKLSHKKMGIEAVSKELGVLCTSIDENKKLFAGFNKKFFKLCSLFENNPRAPFRGPNGQYSLFYHELYGAYWKSSEEATK